MKLTHVIFCISSLLLTGLVATLLFPLAAKSRAEIDFATTPQSAELLDDVDLGEFGEVPVLDLVQYYIENPPVVENTPATEQKTRFQGC